MTIAIVIVFIIVLAVVALMLLPRWRLRVQAERDFSAARGSQHRRQLEQALATIGQRLFNLDTEHAQIKRQLEESREKEARAINAALAKHLISTRLIEVPGIGRVRAEAIKEGIFRGNLSDLYHAHQLNGVGPETQHAISAWVQRIEAEWTSLRENPFPEKAGIERQFAAERQGLTEQKNRIEHLLAQLGDLSLKGRSGVQQLSSVSSDNFRRALERPPEPDEAKRLQRYMLGVFAPWEPIPAWYAELLKSSDGGEARGNARS